MIRNCLEERVHQGDVDHRAFIDDQQIAVERALLVSLEAE